MADYATSKMHAKWPTHISMLVWGLITACSRGDAPPATDSVPPVVAATPAASTLTANWMPDVGSGLIVPSDSEGTAMLLFPEDADVVTGKAFRIVTAGADTSSARVVAATD